MLNARGDPEIFEDGGLGICALKLQETFLQCVCVGGGGGGAPLNSHLIVLLSTKSCLVTVAHDNRIGGGGGRGEKGVVGGSWPRRVLGNLANSAHIATIIPFPLNVLFQLKNKK